MDALIHCQATQRSDDLHRALRQRFQKRGAVAFRQHAGVEDDDDAAVLLRANEPPDALAQFQDRLGQRILGERIAALRLDQLQPRLESRTGCSG